MAFDNWPTTLPSCFVMGTHSEGMGDGRLKTQMDMGPEKARRRSSAIPSALKGSVRMGHAQLEALKTFVRITLLGGSLPFTFPDQLGGAAKLVRFVNLPSWSRTTPKTFMVELDLEVLP